jgi:hypothetical protein
MYDQSDRAYNLRKYTGVSLAWWHSYKWATAKIMVVFGKDFIGPMFHQLFPTKEYAPTKMKLPAMTTYLSYIRLAYPSFRQQLLDLLGRGDLSVRQRTYLTNLRDLCEYFIPVVTVLLVSNIPLLFFLS